MWKFTDNTNLSPWIVLHRYLSTCTTDKLSISPESIKLLSCVANMASVNINIIKHIDWLVFNTNFSSISASWHITMTIVLNQLFTNFHNLQSAGKTNTMIIATCLGESWTHHLCVWLTTCLGESWTHHLCVSHNLSRWVLDSSLVFVTRNLSRWVLDSSFVLVTHNLSRWFLDSSYVFVTLNLSSRWFLDSSYVFVTHNSYRWFLDSLFFTITKNALVRLMTLLGLIKILSYKNLWVFKRHYASSIIALEIKMFPLHMSRAIFKPYEPTQK